MFATWAIGKVRGTPVEVHSSLALGAGCVAIAEAAGLPDSATRIGLEPTSIWLAPWALGLALAATFVLCVVLHELSHVVVARLLGGRTARLTFTVLGGNSSFEHVRS